MIVYNYEGHKSNTEIRMLIILLVSHLIYPDTLVMRGQGRLVDMHTHMHAYMRGQGRHGDTYTHSHTHILKNARMHETGSIVFR